MLAPSWAGSRKEHCECLTFRLIEAFALCGHAGLCVTEPGGRASAWFGLEFVVEGFPLQFVRQASLLYFTCIGWMGFVSGLETLRGAEPQQEYDHSQELCRAMSRANRHGDTPFDRAYGFFSAGAAGVGDWPSTPRRIIGAFIPGCEYGELFRVGCIG